MFKGLLKFQYIADSGNRKIAKITTGLIQQLRNLNFMLRAIQINRVKQGSDLTRYLFIKMV